MLKLVTHWRLRSHPLSVVYMFVVRPITLSSKVAGHVLDAARSVNLDTMADWAEAEAILGRPKRLA